MVNVRDSFLIVLTLKEMSKLRVVGGEFAMQIRHT
jgi:hypothetical protein